MSVLLWLNFRMPLQINCTGSGDGMSSVLCKTKPEFDLGVGTEWACTTGKAHCWDILLPHLRCKRNESCLCQVHMVLTSQGLFKNIDFTVHKLCLEFSLQFMLCHSARLSYGLVDCHATMPKCPCNACRARRRAAWKALLACYSRCKCLLVPLYPCTTRQNLKCKRLEAYFAK